MLNVWHELYTLALSTGTRIGLPVTVALAAVALIGYVFGQRTRSKTIAALDERRQQELERAARIAWQLESIATALRQDLVAHHAQVAAFKRRLREAREVASDAAWEQLCSEAEAMLGPTMQLAHQLSHAYDQIRQQSDALQTFTHGRTDPLTGVGNGRALEQQLRVLLNGTTRGNAGFALALVSLDRDASTLEGRSLASILPLLPGLAGVIRSCMRDTDFVARYGDEEFVIVMPQTSLAGASVFGSRLKRRVADELSATICCGITEVLHGDDSGSLLARADSALYSAKAAGANRQFVHTGTHIRAYVVADEAAGDSREAAATVPCRDSLKIVSGQDNAMEPDDPAELVVTGEPVAI